MLRNRVISPNQSITENNTNNKWKDHSTAGLQINLA